MHSWPASASEAHVAHRLCARPVPKLPGSHKESNMDQVHIFDPLDIMWGKTGVSRWSWSYFQHHISFHTSTTYDLCINHSIYIISWIAKESTNQKSNHTPWSSHTTLNNDNIVASVTLLRACRLETRRSCCQRSFTSSTTAVQAYHIHLDFQAKRQISFNKTWSENAIYVQNQKPQEKVWAFHAISANSVMCVWRFGVFSQARWFRFPSHDASRLGSTQRSHAAASPNSPVPIVKRRWIKGAN